MPPKASFRRSLHHSPYDASGALSVMLRAGGASGSHDGCSVNRGQRLPDHPLSACADDDSQEEGLKPPASHPRYQRASWRARRQAMAETAATPTASPRPKIQTGLLASRKRPNASNDGVACKLIEICSAFEGRRCMTSICSPGRCTVARVESSSLRLSSKALSLKMRAFCITICRVEVSSRLHECRV